MRMTTIRENTPRFQRMIRTSMMMLSVTTTRHRSRCVADDQTGHRLYNDAEALLRSTGQRPIERWLRDPEKPAYGWDSLPTLIYESVHQREPLRVK